MSSAPETLAAIWVDGVLNGGVPGDDPGLLLGMTVFETLRTYNGVPFRLGPHVERFVASANALGITPPEPQEVISEIEAVCRGNVSIRYTLTGAGRRILQRTPITPGIVGRTMRVGSLQWRNPVSLPGAVKHGCRASWIIAARQAGVDEVLLIDESQHILEANRSNIFAVINGELCTPPLDGRQLAGVTREALLEAAHDIGLPCHERPIPLDSHFEELYLASTLKELAPVVEVCGRPLSTGGPIGHRLHAAFRALVSREVSTAL